MASSCSSSSSPAPPASAPAPLERLPREVLLLIFDCVADLASLHRLALASPAAARLLAAVGPEAVEGVLARSAPFQLLQFARLTSALRLAPAAGAVAPSLAEFLRRCGRGAMEPDFRFYVPALPYQAERLRDPGRDVLRDLVVVARRVAALAARCLDFYRARCAHLSPASGGVRPPTWLEEQRVMRSLWRVQVLYELRRLAAVDRTGPRWSAEERRRAARMTVGDLYGGWGRDLEELLTVVEFLEDPSITPAGSAGGDELPMALPDPGTSAWPVLADPPPKGDAESLWADLLAQPSPAKIFLDRHDGLGITGRAQESRLAAYRRFGFSIWERQRFVEWGLMPEAGDYLEDQTRPAVYSKWLGLLSDPTDESTIR